MTNKAALNRSIVSVIPAVHRVTIDRWNADFIKYSRVSSNSVLSDYVSLYSRKGYVTLVSYLDRGAYGLCDITGQYCYVITLELHYRKEIKIPVVNLHDRRQRELWLGKAS